MGIGASRHRGPSPFAMAGLKPRQTTAYMVPYYDWFLANVPVHPDPGARCGKPYCPCAPDPQVPEAHGPGDELVALRELAAASRAMRDHRVECITEMSKNGFVCECENTELTERVCAALAALAVLPPHTPYAQPDES